MSLNVLDYAEISISENKQFLERLAAEKKIKLDKNPDQDIIDKLLSILPKSTEGKILALGVALLFGYLILKK